MLRFVGGGALDVQWAVGPTADSLALPPVLCGPVGFGDVSCCEPWKLLLFLGCTQAFLVECGRSRQREPHGHSMELKAAWLQATSFVQQP